MNKKARKKIEKHQAHMQRWRQITYLVHLLTCAKPETCTFTQEVVAAPPPKVSVHCSAVPRCQALATEILR